MHMGARSTFLASAVSLVVLGCVAPPPAPPVTPQVQPPVAKPGEPAPPSKTLPRYVCDNNVAFTVRFGDGTAEVNAGAQGEHSLLRDAGGVTPQQTVYSSTKLKAEFGLDPQGRGAKLNFASPALEARCLKE